MNKKIIASLLSLFLLTPYVNASLEKDIKKVEIHVAVNGSDINSGMENSPLKTLEGAKSRVRDYRKIYGKDIEISVIFHEGIYNIYNAVHFDENDTGYEGSTVIYKAADGENVEFSGAIAVDVHDFKKVTDSEILKRLPESSRDKVGFLDLKEQGITKDMIPDVPDICTAGDMVWDSKNTFNDVSIILDGEEQPISQYPNGRYNYMTFETVTKGANTVGKGGTFKFTDTHPINWVNAKDMYVSGYFVADYTSIRSKVQSIDKEKRELTLRYGVVSSTASKRWKAFNLLEEIDIPGEWYIDRENLILYYYPRYNMSESRMEITVAADNMILLSPSNTENGPDYITFRGINFRNSRGRAIYATGGCDNITIEKCTFKNIDSGAIRLQGKMGQEASIGSLESTWLHTKNGGRNWLIKDNIFYQMGAGAVALSGGGDSNYYEYSGNVVKNNYFTLWSDATNATAVQINAQIGGTASNNLLHNAPFHAINLGGQEDRILYNEINSVVKSTRDSGGIYVGRRLIERGAEIAYNFIKDTEHIIEGSPQHNRGIYLDDNNAQVYVHHNIVVDGDKPISSGGSSVMIYDNTAVDMSGGYKIMHYGAQWTDSEIKKYETWLSARDKGMSQRVWDMYNNRYPEILEEWEFYKKTGLIAGVNNTVTNNVSFNSPSFQTQSGTDEYFKERNGISFNNFTYEGYDEFVDPENYDYRIKKDSELLKTHPGLLSEDFDLDKIGIQWEEFGGKERVTSLKDFKLIYPQNNAGGIERSEVNFVWQQAVGADRYHFELSDTPDFSNILVNDYTYDNVYIVDELQSNNKTYYWRVTALNETKSLKGEWEPEENNYSFTTSLYDTVNFDSLMVTKNDVMSKKEQITEGDEPGLYKPGTIKNINEYLLKADKLMESSKGTLTQAEVDAFEKELSNTVEQSIWQNHGFVDIGRYMNQKQNWSVLREGTAEIDENLSVVTIGSETSDGNISLLPVSGMSKGVLFGFKLKCDYKGEGNSHWLGLGVRGNDKQIIYGQYNYFVIVKQHLLEYQIRSSGLTGIIETAENNYIKDGEWHDVIFGAYDCGFGQMTVLIVDGEVVFNYLDDTENQLRFEGCLTFYTTKGMKLSIKPYDNEFDIDFDTLVDNSVMDATIKRAKAMEKNVGSENTVIMADGAKSYYANGEIKKSENAVCYTVNDTTYIPVEVLKKHYNITIQEEDIVSDKDGEYISSILLIEKYGLYVYYLDKLVIVTDRNDFYMYNGTIPYNMGMLAQELEAVSKQNN